MTLTSDILPSLGKAAPRGSTARSGPSPPTPTRRAGSASASVPLTDIADEFGTPTYVIDEADFRSRARRYRKALREAEVVYAGKSLLTIAVARWAREEGLGIDVCSAGELAVALAGGVEPARIIMHGNAKSLDELREAVRRRGRAHRAGFVHRDRLPRGPGAPAPAGAHPGDPRHRHPRPPRGHHRDQRPEVRIHPDDDHAADAVQRVLAHPILDLIGLHCHIGSQVTDAALYGEAIHRMIAAMADIRAQHGVILTELNIGGGHGIPYLAGDPGARASTELARVIEDALDEACAAEHFPRPTIVVEPGRGHQRPGRRHPVPGVLGQDTARWTHLRRRRRRHERQPAGVVVRRAIHGRAGQPAFAGHQAAGHRGGPALRGGRRDRPRRRATGRRAPGRPAGGGLHRLLPPQHGVELQHGRATAAGGGQGRPGPPAGSPRNDR